MKNNSRARSTLWLALGLVIACCVLWFALGGSHEPGRVIEPARSAASFVAPIVSDIVPAESEAASPESIAPQAEPKAESRRVPAETTAVAGAPLRAGNLVVRARDLTRLGPLRWFDVRVANTARFAERRSGPLAGEIELPLTPGMYSLLVLSPGYEPVEIRRVEVPSGETVRLDSIDLRPGSGSIQVRVISASAPDRKLMVELRGEGRHPCARCADRDDDLALVRRADEEARGRVDAKNAGATTSRVDRAWNREGSCPDCGYAQEQSSAWVHAGQSFAFVNLASGSYALRIADTDGRTIDKPRQLALEDGQALSVEFECSPTRMLEIELLGLDGRSLTQEWSQRIVAAKSNVERVELVSDSEEAYEIVVADDRVEWARCTIVPPSVDGHRRFRPTAFGGRKLGTGPARNSARVQTIDRPRRADEALRPAVKAPVFAPVAVQCEIGEHGFVTMDPLPTSSLQVRVLSARNEGEALVPAARDTTRVSVHLHAN